MNIAELKVRIENKIHGKDLSKVQDVNNLIYEAAGNILLAIDPAETKRTVDLTNGLYDRVYSYQVPVDLKGDRIISILPQGKMSPADNMHQVYGKEFNLYKTNNSFDIEINSGVKTVNISKALTAGITLNTADSITSNGTWIAGGDASNLVVDTVNFLTGSASLKFDLADSGTAGYIENSTMSAVDLTNYLNTGSIFIPVYIPSTSITSISIRFGTDSSNYYSGSSSTTQDNTSFVVGWNLIRFDWAALTTTGTPTITSTQYIRVQFNYTGTAILACRVDSVVARLPSSFKINYYSKYLFKNTSGVWIEKPTDINDTDIINLDTESFNLLLYEVCFLIAQEISGEDGVFDVTFWEKQRDKTWKEYKNSYKSETQKRRSTYYRLR